MVSVLDGSSVSVDDSPSVLEDVMGGGTEVVVGWSVVVVVVFPGSGVVDVPVPTSLQRFIYGLRSSGT